VGEGASIAFAPSPPPQPWTFGSVFAKLPPTLSNTAQARSNISILLAAIAQFEVEHPDVKDYVVFRLAHDTWATPEQAQAMHDEGVEADVSLESTVATGAYPIARMPLGGEVLSKEIDPIAQNPATNFQLNDLLGVLVTDPTNVSQVGGIFGDASLKYLLEARVRCLLGTDAAGVEHSDIVKEYQYAASPDRLLEPNRPHVSRALGRRQFSGALRQRSLAPIEHGCRPSDPVLVARRLRAADLDASRSRSCCRRAIISARLRFFSIERVCDFGRILAPQTRTS
jgi:hypothetical protein